MNDKVYFDSIKAIISEYFVNKIGQCRGEDLDKLIADKNEFLQKTESVFRRFQFTKKLCAESIRIIAQDDEA